MLCNKFQPVSGNSFLSGMDEGIFQQSQIEQPPPEAAFLPAGDLRENFNFPTGQVGKRRAFSQKNPNIFQKNFSFFFGTRKNAENLAYLCKKTNRRPVSV